MAKLRIQVQRRHKVFEFNNYRHVLHGVQEIAKHEGIKGLWKGAGARVAFYAPAAAITIAAFEELKKIYSQFV